MDLSLLDVNGSNFMLCGICFEGNNLDAFDCLSAVVCPQWVIRISSGRDVNLMDSWALAWLATNAVE